MDARNQDVSDPIMQQKKLFFFFPPDVCVTVILNGARCSPNPVYHVGWMFEGKKSFKCPGAL